MTVSLAERSAAHVSTYWRKTQDAEIKALLPSSAQSEEQALEMFQKSLLPAATSYGKVILADGQYVGDIWCYCIDEQEEKSINTIYQFPAFQAKSVKLLLEIQSDFVILFVRNREAGRDSDDFIFKLFHANTPLRNFVFVDSVFLQVLCNALTQQRIQYGTQRDENQHTQHTEGAAADRHSHKDPHSRKSNGTAYHFWIDEIAFQLLQNEENSNKGQHFDEAIGHQDHECADDAADKGAKYGKQCSNTDKDADHQGVWEAENGHDNEEQSSKHQSFHALSGQKTGEGFIGKTGDGEDSVSDILRKVSVNQTAYLSANGLFLHQQIDGEDKANEKGENSAENTAGYVDSGVDKAARTVTQEANDILYDGFPVQSGKFLRTRQVGEELIQEGWVFLFQISQELNDIVAEQNKAAAQFRDDQSKDNSDQCDQQQQGQHQRNRAFDFIGDFSAFAEQQTFDFPHGYIENKSDAAAQKKWQNQAEHSAADAAQQT